MGMRNFTNVPIPNWLVEEVDAKKGMAKRATFVAALIEKGLKIGVEA